MNNEYDDDDAPGGQSAGPVVRIDIRKITAEQLAGLGVSQIAYVKPVMHNGVRAFAIHAADGTRMGMAPDASLAAAAIVQHEMIAAMLQ